MRSTTRKPSLFRHRDLRIVLPALVGVRVGDALVLFALTLRVFSSGGGPALIALLAAAFAVPTILCVGIAGYVVDRYDSRMILLLTSLTQVIAVVGLALSPPAAGMYLLVVLLQVGQSFASPTWAALLPRIVGEEDLGRASALQQSALLMSGAVGAAGAGLLVAQFGVPLTLAVASLGFVGVGVAALAVTTRRVAAPGSFSATSVSPLSRIWSAEGFAVLRADRVNWVLFSATIPFLLALETINIAEVFLVKGALGASTTEFGVLQAVSAVGALGGAWYAARIDKESTRVVVVVAGIGAGGLGMALAGLAPNVVVLGVASVIIGATVMASGSALFPVLMLRTADKDRGKVNAAVGGANRTMTVLALGVGAVAGSLVSPRHIFVAAAVMSVAVAAWSWWATRDLLTARSSDTTAAGSPDGGVEGRPEPGAHR